MQPDSRTAAPLLSVEQAQSRIDRRIRPLTETESIRLEAASGRILAENIVATMDVPPYRNSAMDGYAINTQGLGGDAAEQTLAVAGTALAGRPWHGAVQARQCVRIMTGAPLPAGTDAVVIQENIVRDGERIYFTGPVEAGRNVREAGEDIRRGTAVFERGRRLGAADLGVLASLGRDSVAVFRPLRVLFFTSGDEVRPPGQTLGYGELYDSNRYLLAGLLGHPGINAAYAGNLPDKPGMLRRRLAEAAAQADAVITCGGVSVGEADYITGVLESLGEIEFCKVAVKPGKPLNFGRLDSALFFGLPGNPVSAMVTFLLFAGPALRKLAGQSPVSAPLPLPAVLETPLRKRPGRAEYQRGVLSPRADGGLQVHPGRAQGSHQLSALSTANCLIVLDAESGDRPTGQTVPVLRLGDLL